MKDNAEKKDSKILVIDDDLGNLHAMQMLLESRGYTNLPQSKDMKEVRGFADSVEGLEYFNSEDVDLVLLDINMPKKNGMIVAEEMYKSKPEVPIIIITAALGKKEIERLKVLFSGFKNVKGYHEKPLKKDLFLPDLEKALEGA